MMGLRRPETRTSSTYQEAHDRRRKQMIAISYTNVSIHFM
jgi:hypothetical protein